MARGRKGSRNDHTGEDLGAPLPERVSFEERSKDCPIEVVRRGRRIELTPELIAVYGRALNQGTQEMAAAMIGISVRTIGDWLLKAEDPKCEDEMLLLLRDTHNAVMSGGNRAVTVALVMEHAVDDPKIALELAKAWVPGFAQPKTVKKDVNITLGHKAPDMSAFENRSEEEILILAALQRAEQKRLNGGT